MIVSGRRAASLALLLAAAATVYAAIGYWPWGAIGPSGFFTTADELYLREWLIYAAYTHRIAPTFPYGTLFHIWMGGWMWAIVQVQPAALGLESFTSWVRAGNGLLWVMFGSYLIFGAVPPHRRIWTVLTLVNPVVLFAAFGYAKPDFLMFALATIAALHWSRALTLGKTLDLYLAAAFFGAATATKPSVLLLTGPWYLAMAVWSHARSTFGTQRLVTAALASAAVCLTLSWEYIDLPAAIGSLIAESELVRHGFPGTQVYSPATWIVVLCLSFPLR